MIVFTLFSQLYIKCCSHPPSPVPLGAATGYDMQHLAVYCQRIAVGAVRVKVHADLSYLS